MRRTLVGPLLIFLPWSPAAFYTANNWKRFENEDHVVRRDRGGSCVMQFTQAFVISEHRRTDDWSCLIKEVRASISK
jgi:hypothetical protein